MARTRSEYRLRPVSVSRPASPPTTREPTVEDRGDLAVLLLDAYRGTIDDEGEGPDEALAAIDHYLGTIDRDRSLLAVDGGRLLGMCFVVEVGGILYVDPIAVAGAQKAQGLGTSLVQLVLDGLREARVPEVGAVITDGNVASERLFTRLGFTRTGRWG